MGKLTDEQKLNIKNILDSKEFKSDLYEGLPQERRKALGQFYTPSDLVIKMLEKLDWCNNLSGKNILDPSCGSGNLLIGCLAAGADSDKLFGNEYDEIAVELCRTRLNRACDILHKPHIRFWQIHQGNALQKRCLLDFSENYINTYDVTKINDLKYAQEYSEDRKEVKEKKLHKLTIDDLFNYM